jgi:hypothetical protein
VSESEAIGLMLPAVPLRRIAGESHVLRVGGSHDARSLTKQWLTDGYFGAPSQEGSSGPTWMKDFSNTSPWL